MSEKGNIKESVKEREGLKTERRKKERFCPGTVVLFEIGKFQKTTGFPIRKLPFVRWVREQSSDLWFQALALLASQDAAEAYVVNLFKDANLYTIHKKRIMLMHKDIQLPQRIWRDTVKYIPV